MMTADQLLALLPLIALTAGSALVMLTIAFRRNHDLIFGLTIASLVATLAALGPAAGVAPQTVTTLLIIDHYAIFFIGLVCCAALAAMMPCRPYLAARSSQPEEFYILLLSSLLGAAVLVASRHFASLFLGLEMLSVSLFALIAYPRRDKRALEAAMKYLVLSGISSAFLVFGMALIYAELGTLEFSRMYLPEPTLTLIAGMVLIVSALGFKLSLAPFHLWTADVYQGAPAPVAALLATVSKGAVFALLFRYGLAGGLSWHRTILDVLTLLAAASILVGNLSALRQNNLKRMLAYSSIAHMGYLMITLVAAGRIDARFAVESMSFYLVAYFITTLAAFGVMTVLSPAERDAELLDDYTGLFWTRPWLAGLLTLAMLSLAGIPLTAGFIGKFYLFTAGSQGSLWVLLILLIIGSGLGLYYYVRVIFQMSRPPGTAGQDVTRLPPLAPRGASVTLAILGILLLGMGVAPAPFIDFLTPVSHSGSAEPRLTTR